MMASHSEATAVDDDTSGLSLADIVREGLPGLIAEYGHRLSHDQHRALTAITQCRTPACGALLIRCGDCDHSGTLPRSCGHRSCPACQHHTTGEWLDRQAAKLLPVDYFMVTFTLPAGLRGVASCHSKTVYAALFARPALHSKHSANATSWPLIWACVPYCIPMPAIWISIRMCISSCLAGVCIKSGANGANSKAGICSMLGRWPRCFERKCWSG